MKIHPYSQTVQYIPALSFMGEQMINIIYLKHFFLVNSNQGIEPMDIALD